MVNFLFMRKTTNAHLRSVFSYIFLAFYSLPLHVSVTPVTVFRLSFSSLWGGQRWSPSHFKIGARWSLVRLMSRQLYTWRNILRYLLSSKVDGARSLSVHFGDEKPPFPAGIDQRFLGRPTHSLATLPFQLLGLFKIIYNSEK